MLQIITQLARNIFVFTILVLVLVLFQRPVVGQATSVSQLSDVKPTSWAWQVLESLVGRYGCEYGYPDRTFRGNRAPTRYEMVSSFDLCFSIINDRIDKQTDPINEQTNEALATLQEVLKLEKLQESLENERIALENKIDVLQSRILELETLQ